MKNNFEILTTVDKALHFKGSYTIQEVRKQLYKVFSQHGFRRSYKKISNVFQFNDTADEAYLVESGRVRTYKLSSEGKEVTFEIINPGESVGLAEVLVNCPRKRYAETVNKTVLWVMNKDQLLNLVLTHKEFGYDLMWAMAHYLLRFQDLVEDLTILPVRGRVIQLLIKMSMERGTQVGDYIIIDLPITHEEIAKMVGSSRQTISVILNHLREQGILNWEQKKIKILSWKELNILNLSNSNQQDKS